MKEEYGCCCIGVTFAVLNFDGVLGPQCCPYVITTSRNTNIDIDKAQYPYVNGIYIPIVDDSNS